MSTYKNLIAWKKGVEITKEVYALSGELPMTERFNLISQMNRAAISIPSNIAEGWGRESLKSYQMFLKIARGSLYELETQIIIINELGITPSEKLNKITILIEEEIRIINGLIRSLQRQLPPTS